MCAEFDRQSCSDLGPKRLRLKTYQFSEFFLSKISPDTKNPIKGKHTCSFTHAQKGPKLGISGKMISNNCTLT